MNETAPKTLVATCEVCGRVITPCGSSAEDCIHIRRRRCFQHILTEEKP